jgi:hypothetical protein
MVEGLCVHILVVDHQLIEVDLILAGFSSLEPVYTSFQH